ncbi:MAG: hypothetical protein Q9P01_08330 [Anaerolineae bacterium]|nr:hypothetical protein [Anaerolineae bacterium]
MADINWTYKNLHFPEGEDHLNHARRRFIFDQLLILQLGSLSKRREWQSVPGQPLLVEDAWLGEFLSAVFPYELTGAQSRALQQIREDIAKEIPMNRLLQGDVGSGKTAVALATIGIALQKWRTSSTRWR